MEYAGKQKSCLRLLLLTLRGGRWCRRLLEDIPPPGRMRVKAGKGGRCFFWVLLVALGWGLMRPGTLFARAAEESGARLVPGLVPGMTFHLALAPEEVRSLGLEQVSVWMAREAVRAKSVFYLDWFSSVALLVRVGWAEGSVLLEGPEDVMIGPQWPRLEEELEEPVVVEAAAGGEVRLRYFKKNLSAQLTQKLRGWLLGVSAVESDPDQPVVVSRTARWSLSFWQKVRGFRDLSFMEVTQWGVSQWWVETHPLQATLAHALSSPRLWKIFAFLGVKSVVLRQLSVLGWDLQRSKVALAKKLMQSHADSACREWGARGAVAQKHATPLQLLALSEADFQEGKVFLDGKPLSEFPAPGSLGPGMGEPGLFYLYWQPIWCDRGRWRQALALDVLMKKVTNRKQVWEDRQQKLSHAEDLRQARSED